ncbi:MAG: hypothetical protein EBZ58_13665 [Bacteroidetes bacterium]|jgi:hypothetical protein|nr:hypothetical protein [Bacteroidota bacterium]
MKLPAIKELVEKYDIETLRAAEDAILNEQIPAIEVNGDDEGEKLTHVLGAIDVLEKVQVEGKDKSLALREFFQRVRNSIS